MFTPPFLKNGDTVGLIAPASYIEKAQWEPVIPLLHSWGLDVKTGNSLYLRDGVFAGADAQRLQDFVAMMRAPEIKAVFCARGGYGCIRLLHELKRFSSTFVPKWLIGYSDITVLAAFLNNQMQWQTIHGPMPVDLADKQTPEGEKSWDYLRSMLFGEIPSYTLPAHNLNRCGTTTAPIIGGNLSLIFSLNATPFQWQTAGCILFIEDIGEKLYHLDRMMTNLRIGGQLANLKGLIVGAMNEMHDSEPSFGKTAFEIIASHVEAEQFPTLFGFPAGHAGVNFPLALGANYMMQVTNTEVFVSLQT